MSNKIKFNSIFLILFLLNVILIGIETKANTSTENTCPLNIEFSTLIGGNGEDGTGNIVLDTEGNILMATKTDSTDFPLVNPYQISNNGLDDGIIFKFSSDGQELLYSTYFGGSGNDIVFDVALDSEGNIIITGTTDSADFPMKNALNDTKSASERDVFLSKFSADGQELLFSTYICGTNNWVASLALDSSDNIYLMGSTESETLQATIGTYQPTIKNSTDAFLTKMSSDGQTVFYSTYFGGNDFDNIRSMNLDSDNNVIFCGYTSSEDLPLVNNFQNKSVSTYDNYITKISSDGTNLLFSSYFGGNRQWGLAKLIVDSNDDIIYIGETNSVDFPILNAFQSSYGGGETDGFVSKIDGEDYTLQFATFLGGVGYEGAHGVIIDNYNDLVITGTTGSTDFPTLNKYQNYKGSLDVFIVKMSDEGQLKQIATFFGGYGSDYSLGIILEPITNSIFMGGHTSSSTFPLVNPYQDVYKGGDFDTFICKFSLNETTTNIGINGVFICSFLFFILILSTFYSKFKRKSSNR